MDDAIVVGGGPAGLFSAYLLSKAGKKVSVYEEHGKIGRPVQCTGIVTRALENTVIKIPEEIVVNRIRKARIHAGRSYVEFRIDDNILDRAAFDRYLSEIAQSAGANIIKDTKVGAVMKEAGESDKPGIFIGSGVVNAESIIGADGPFSITRAAVDPECQVRFYKGKQAVVRGSFEEDVFEVYLGDIARGFFAWVVPESGTIARMGLASKENPNRGFDALMKIRGHSEKDIIEFRSGMIPVYNPKLRTEDWPLYLVGDAATQVKATTGGGLVPGLKSARILAESIINCRDYEPEWKKTVGRSLWADLKIRKILESFSEKDYSDIIKLLSSSRIRDTLEEYERDRPIALLGSLALKEPRLLKYGLRLITG